MGLRRSFRPLIHILDGENVWHQVISPTQSALVLASWEPDFELLELEHKRILLFLNQGLTPEIQVGANNKKHDNCRGEHLLGIPTGSRPDFVFRRGSGEGQALDLRLIGTRGQVAYPHHDHR